MGDLRRPDPEPPTGQPTVEHKPGLASQMLRELAPLLAEDGIDVDHLDDIDPAALQAAMSRAVERRNIELLSPVGQARADTITTLRLATEAITDDDTHLATAICDAVPSEAPTGDIATVASCIGVALGLLDQWLAGSGTPPGLAGKIRLPAGHWTGERAAADILALARGGAAFDSLDALITNHDGQHVLYGAVLALAATILTWSQQADTPLHALIRDNLC